METNAEIKEVVRRKYAVIAFSIQVLGVHAVELMQVPQNSLFSF